MLNDFSPCIVLFWFARKFPLAFFPFFALCTRFAWWCDLLSLSCCCIYVIEKGTHLGIFYYICFGFFLFLSSIQSMYVHWVLFSPFLYNFLKIDTFPLISSGFVFCFVYFHRFHNIQCSSFLVQVKNIALFCFASTSGRALFVLLLFVLLDVNLFSCF